MSAPTRFSFGELAVTGQLLGLFLMLHGAGCGSSQSEPSTSSQPSAAEGSEAAGGVPGVQIDAKIDALDVECEPGKREQCNALDDDCNGVIDDGCGYHSGGVQVTVAWNTPADIDLYVTDPSGEILYYNEDHERTSIGGHLDHNARGDCRREQKLSRIENAYWPEPAPSGSYQIALHYFSPCASNVVTQATVSVAVGGKLVGSYGCSLEPEERVEALSLDIQ